MEQVVLRVRELQEQLRLVGDDAKAQLLGWQAGSTEPAAGAAKPCTEPRRPLPGARASIRSAYEWCGMPQAGTAVQHGAARRRQLHSSQLLARKITLEAQALRARI